MIHGTTLMVAALAAFGSTTSAAAQDTIRPSAPETLTTLTVDEAVQQALEHNLNLLAERDNVRVADAAVLTASLRPNPVVTVGTTRPDQSLVDAGISPYEQIVRTDFVMERGGKRERRIDDITHEVASAYAEYTLARRLVDTIETQMLAPARDVRATTEYAYRRGEATFIELLDAQRAFNETMRGYHEARAQYAQSLYALDALTTGSGRP
jgi:outer membrane protein TolC